MGHEVHQYIVSHPVSLVEVVLESVQASLNTNDASSLKFDLKAEVSGEALSPSEGLCYLDLHVIGKPEQAADAVLDFRCRVRGRCEVKNPGTQAQLERFLKVQGLALLLPFSREFVASTTMRMGIRQVMLPFIDVFETARKIEAASSSENPGDEGGN